VKDCKPAPALTQGQVRAAFQRAGLPIPKYLRASACVEGPKPKGDGAEPSTQALAARMHSFAWAASEGRRAWTRKLRASVKAVQGWR